MILLRYLLFPFAILYGCITSARNFLYDKGILKSYSFDVPIIAVGNLSVGGTGKTPQIEYLIRLLSSHYKVATLSRGYKRKSKGFVLANATSSAAVLGDEPFQMFQKFPNVLVSVDTNRKNGIEQLLQSTDSPEVILLDDAFQHRKVKAGLYILLTAYDDLYYNDWMLPTGNLRESRSGAKRADMIIITKCPKDISELAQENIKKSIDLDVPIYFSFIDYDTNVFNEKEHRAVANLDHVDKLLVAGIARPEPFFNYLQAKKEACLVFSDHHDFSENDYNLIQSKANNKIIITTEKDYVRLNKQRLNVPVFYLPIRSSFINDCGNFEKTILDYVGTSTRNR
jgi:tetraacyldisaccharide 4'-kinase